MLGAGRGAKTPPLEHFLLGNHGGGQDPHKFVSTIQEKNVSLLFQIFFLPILDRNFATIIT
jgi:hypothetical protein